MSKAAGTKAGAAAAEERKRAAGRRIARSLAATAAAPVVTGCFQAVAVPVFLGCWGAQRYGAWLVLAALPAALNFADLGLGAVAGTEMTMRVAAEEREAALEVFATTWWTTTLLALGGAVLAAAATAVLPLESLTGTALPLREARIVVPALAACALMSVESGVLSAGLRSDGNYAAGTAVAALGRLAELGATVAGVALGARPAQVALLWLACRVATLAALWMLLRRRSPWLRLGFGHTRRACLRRLLAPAISFLGFPAANALSGEGMVLALGATLGPVPVVAFATMRTLTRAAFQLTDVVKNSVWPELSAAFGAGDLALACSIHRRACQLSLGLAGGAVLGLAAGGEWMLAMWTRGRAGFDGTVFALLLAVLLVNATWYTSSAALVACNRHARVALLQAATAAAAMSLAAVLVPRFGLRAAALALLAAEAAMSATVLPASLGLLGDSLRGFTGSLLQWRVAFSRS